VTLTSLTDQWAAVAVAGPSSAALLGSIVQGLDIANGSKFPHMTVGEGKLGKIPVLIQRVSYSGERAYEIYAPAGYGAALWEVLREAGRAHGLVPYGTEAMGILRIEKGHVAGPEIDGRTTLEDLGLGKLAKTGRPFVGSVLRRREALLDEDRPQLVGFVPLDLLDTIPAGAILQPRGGPHEGHGLGHVSSAAFSPSLGHAIALGFIKGGVRRRGEQFDACNPLKGEVIPVEVVSPKFFDAQGKRLHA
jgi:sarcosine oxidase subunit alpha